MNASELKFYTDLLTVAALFIGMVACAFIVWKFWKDSADDCTPDIERLINSAPTCYGDFPFCRPHQQNERECWTCLYHKTCRDVTNKEIGS